MNTPNQTTPKCGPTDARIAVCCFIGCENRATKCVWSHPFGFEDYTHSCNDHIEDLKLDDSDVVEDLV